MIRVRLPKDGKWMRQGEREIWLNPSRDIVNSFPDYCLRACEQLQNLNAPTVQWFYEQGGTNEELAAFSRFIKEWIMAANDPESGDVATVARKLGLLDFPLRVRLAFGSAMLNTVISAFFAGTRESYIGPDEQVSYRTLFEILEGAFAA